jgi:hypothetical protein
MDLTDLVPPADGGLVHLRRPDARAAALHRFVGATLAGRDGDVVWVDAGGDAATLTLDDHLPPGHDLADVRVARAFTAYQHHSLVRRAVDESDDDTALVVAPCTAALYRDDDVPDHLASDLLDASLATLGELAGAVDAPVVVTTPGDDAPGDGAVAERADRTVECERTRAGLRFVGPDAETTVYRDAGGFQTTIPYWVDLFGCRCDEEPVVAPATAAPLEG